MKSIALFNVLDKVDSTNNYAMGKVHAGLAKSGMAWFATEQTIGKGQRGKNWESKPGENITMSVVFEPLRSFWPHPFLFNALITNTCRAFLSKLIDAEIKIKWPNDLYINDRKAGGILIENVYMGQSWNWAVVGVGINCNQLDFSEDIKNPVSLTTITGKKYDVVALAKDLHFLLVNTFNTSPQSTNASILSQYNEHLFRKNEKQRLRKENAVFETTIQEVSEFGQLLTIDSISRVFNFGEVDWVL